MTGHYENRVVALAFLLATGIMTYLMQQVFITLMVFSVFCLQDDFPVAEANEHSFKPITGQDRNQLVNSKTYCLKDYSAPSVNPSSPEGTVALGLRSPDRAAPRDEVGCHSAWLRRVPQRLHWRIIAADEAGGELMALVSAPYPVNLNSPVFYTDNQNYSRKIESGNLSDSKAEQTCLISVLKEIFRNEKVPHNLVWLAEVESSLNPNAESKVGAVGLFQLMPATAERFGLQLFPVDDRKTPDKSARAAASYLRHLHKEFGGWALALAAYNAGEGRVSRTMKSHNARTFCEVAPHLPSETRKYVPRVMAMMALREDQSLGVPSAYFMP